MVIKAVLFDTDGVIINSEMFSIIYSKKYNIPYDEMLPFFKGEFQDCIIGKADLSEIVKPWLKKWKWEGSVKEFLEFWFKSEHNLDKNIIKIIKDLRKKGIKCYIATNQEKHRTEYMKNEMDFEDLFDEVFSSSDIGYKKPNKRFYEFVINKIKDKYKINADEIIFFDDSQENVDEAKKLGIKANLYKTFDEFKSILKPFL
jgi:putative hydrolase of the HAD superfamily